MSMKIGVTQYCLGDMPLDDTLSLCREAGYEAVELVFRPGKDLDPDLSEAEIREVRCKCADAGVAITSVVAVLGFGSLLSRDHVQQVEMARRMNKIRKLGDD